MLKEGEVFGENGGDDGGANSGHVGIGVVN